MLVIRYLRYRFDKLYRTFRQKCFTSYFNACDVHNSVTMMLFPVSSVCMCLLIIRLLGVVRFIASTPSNANVSPTCRFVSFLVLAAAISGTISSIPRVFCMAFYTFFTSETHELIYTKNVRKLKFSWTCVFVLLPENFKLIHRTR